MSRMKITAAFFDAYAKLTSAGGAISKAVLNKNNAEVDAAIVKLEEAVTAFREARKLTETTWS